MSISDKEIEAATRGIMASLGLDDCWSADGRSSVQQYWRKHIRAALAAARPAPADAGLLAALKHIIFIPTNVPGGITAEDALTAIVAEARSAITKAEAAAPPPPDGAGTT